MHIKSTEQSKADGLKLPNLATLIYVRKFSVKIFLLNYVGHENGWIGL